MKLIATIAVTIVVVIVLIVVALVVMSFRRGIQSIKNQQKIHSRNSYNSSSRSKSSNRRSSNIIKDLVDEINPFRLSDEDKQKLTIKRPRAAIKPTFNKEDTFKFRVAAVKNNYVKLPKSFSAISNWPDQILGVFDQEHCSNCWSYACCSMMTDRIRIKSEGKLLSDGNFISPTSFSACMKCGKDGACNRFCEGSYLDDVLQFMVENGAIAQHDIDKHSSTPEAYLCFDAEKYGVKLWKGVEKYRVNLFPPSMLTNKQNLLDNEEAIKQEIYKNGTVVGIIKIYIPDDYRNIYLHKKGVYGYGWDSEPRESAGYHAICYLGWGEDVVENKKTGKSETVKYWIIRNSWGDWGDSKGFAKVLRGVNFGYCESDTFAITPSI